MFNWQNWLTAQRLKKTLIGYWLAIPVLFLAYILLYMATHEINFLNLLQTLPIVALSLILTLLLFFQVFILRLVSNHCNARHSMLGSFLKFSMFQQFLSLNFIGFFLCFGYYLSLEKQKVAQHFSQRHYLQIYTFTAFVGALTVLSVILRTIV